MLTGALLFLRSPLGHYVALGLALVALVGGIFGFGHHAGVSSEKAKEAHRHELALAGAKKREAAAAAISQGSATALAQERVQIEYRTRTLIQKVPQYVTVADDRRCTVNAGFVRLHDAAAAGAASLPGAAGGSDEAPSGVPLSAVLSTVASNYGTAYDYRAEVLAWRSWYTDQLAAWGKK